MVLQIEKITLTEDGIEALEIVQGLYPDLDKEEQYVILIGMAKEDATLDYVIAEQGATDELVLCHCKECNQDIYMGIGYLGHRFWIKSGICPKCNLLKYKRK